MLVTRNKGISATAPAAARIAATDKGALRRAGKMTAAAANARVTRIIAPKLRGSVTPSNTTNGAPLANMLSISPTGNNALATTP